MPIYARNAQPLSLARGEALSLVCTPYSTVQNTDITGWTLAFVVRPVGADLDDPAAISRTIGDGITVTSASLGQFTSTLTKAQTLSLAVGVYDWETWRTDAGAETRLNFGKLQIVRSVQYPV